VGFALENDVVLEFSDLSDLVFVVVGYGFGVRVDVTGVPVVPPVMLVDPPNVCVAFDW
jgi:hypothetical protein